MTNQNYLKLINDNLMVGVRIAFMAVLTPFFVSCFSLRKKDGSTIHEVTFIFKADLFSLEQRRLMTIEDSVRISYVNDMTIYRINIPHEQSRSLPSDLKGEPMEAIETSVRYKYFVAKRGVDYGFEFDSLATVKPKRQPVQAFVSRKIPFDPKMFEVDKDSLVSVSSLSNNQFFEKYVPKIKIDDTYPDTSFYYYDQTLKKVSFFFSPALDSVKDSKLYKIVFKFNSKEETGREATTIPAREFLYELKKA